MTFMGCWHASENSESPSSFFPCFQEILLALLCMFHVSDEATHADSRHQKILEFSCHETECRYETRHANVRLLFRNVSGWIFNMEGTGAKGIVYRVMFNINSSDLIFFGRCDICLEKHQFCSILQMLHAALVHKKIGKKMEITLGKEKHEEERKITKKARRQIKMLTNLELTNYRYMKFS